MSGSGVAIASLLLMLLCIGAGMHMAVALGLVSFLGIWAIRADAGIAAQLLAQAASDAIASHIFGVVPLFVLTGLLVARAGLGDDAFAVAHQLLARVRAGLGLATVAANAVFAAVTGISIASAAVFTRVAVPPMRRHGYRPRFAVGVVAGSSVLGMLIPPSLLMVLYGFLSNQSVGDLFTAGVLPGLLLALAFAVGVWAMATWWPGAVFATAGDEAGTGAPPMRMGEMVSRLAPTLLMIGVVIGGLYGGFFTATEAGAVGALLALLVALVRGRLRPRTLWAVLVETGHVTVAVSFLIICANTYSRMLAMSGLPQTLLAQFAAWGLGPQAFLLAHIGVIILLGMVIDASSILLIVLPLVLPLADQFGFNLVWFGIVTIIAVEIGLLTPPFGLSAFVVHSSLNDPRVGLGDVFAGALPFTLIMLAVLAAVVAFPALTLALL